MTKILLFLIAVYRAVLSPALYFLGARCRFHPSCSTYAKAAFERFDFLQAVGLTLKRLSKCGPWHEGGVDPIPTNIKG